MAEIDVGDNIGANLQADQAAADLRVAQAQAEKRRALAVALEQEMKAAVEENRAKVMLAEAEVPLAISGCLPRGQARRHGLLQPCAICNPTPKCATRSPAPARAWAATASTTVQGSRGDRFAACGLPRSPIANCERQAASGVEREESHGMGRLGHSVDCGRRVDSIESGQELSGPDAPPARASSAAADRSRTGWTVDAGARRRRVDPRGDPFDATRTRRPVVRRCRAGADPAEAAARRAAAPAPRRSNQRPLRPRNVVMQPELTVEPPPPRSPYVRCRRSLSAFTTP